MKKSIQAMKIAHGIKNNFKSFKAALIAAWQIIKNKAVKFAKEDGEIREAHFETFTTIELRKGYARFVEILSDGSTQFRSLRFDRIL